MYEKNTKQSIPKNGGIPGIDELKVKEARKVAQKLKLLWPVKMTRYRKINGLSPLNPAEVIALSSIFNQYGIDPLTGKVLKTA